MAMVTAEISPSGAASPAVFVCELGLRRDVRYRPLQMTAQAAVTPLAAEPSEVRVWPPSDGIVLACQLRIRIRTVLASSQVTDTAGKLTLAGISVEDARSMLDRC
jgi:hypothetical protein